MIQLLEKYGRPVFDLYLNSSIHVALAVTSFTGITFFSLNLPADFPLLTFVFFSSVTAYNLTKYGGDLERLNQPGLTAIRWITAATLTGTIVCATLMSPLLIAAAAVLSIITLSYSWPLFQNQTTLREIAGFKIFIIAFIWASVSVGFPVLQAGITLQNNVLLEYLQRLIFVLVLTLPFDIRDIRFDTYQLGTIPQIIGIKKTRLLGVGLLAAAVLLELLKEPLNLHQVILFLFISILTGILVMKTVVHQTRYYTSFWVEGIPIIWVVLAIIVYNF